ncbi:MAG TPA: FHA domain-containing protein [Polyangia bacterium]|nr:FHA domain-containing protein [Polyangia bacterium]
MFRGRDRDLDWDVSEGADREARRRGTIFLPAQATPPPEFGDVFERIFPEVTRLHAGFARDGLLAVAAWDGSVLADYVHVPLGREPEFVIVGRHDRCDLSLHRDPTLSLRHAVVGARAVGGELRLRFLDLHSGLGFHTEDGQRCEALTADGAMFVRMGGYHLFLLPTGSLAPLPWGSTAEETWKMIPDRVYRDFRVAPRHPEMAALHSDPTRPQTIITRIVDPPGMLRPLRPAPGDRGARVARVELSSQTGHERFSLHESELDRGLLVGRYERCQLGASDDKMSRVHLLIIRDGDDTWAIDTGSTNGTRAGGESVRRVALREGTALELGKHITLRWFSTGPESEPPVDDPPAPPPAASDSDLLAP